MIYTLKNERLLFWRKFLLDTLEIQRYLSYVNEILRYLSYVNENNDVKNIVCWLSFINKAS